MTYAGARMTGYMRGEFEIKERKRTKGKEISELQEGEKLE